MNVKSQKNSNEKKKEYLEATTSQPHDNTYVHTHNLMLNLPEGISSTIYQKAGKLIT